MQASPEKVAWSSKGSSDINADNSIELKGSTSWQEVTLYFRAPKLEQIKRVRLDVMKSARFQTHGDKKMILFEVKPSLADVKNGTTPLEFQTCRSQGNEADETTANCIDFLTDTGWTVPNFFGKDGCHQLVLELRKPVRLRRGSMFAMTIDSGGAPDVMPLGRVSVSFSGQFEVSGEPQSSEQ